MLRFAAYFLLVSLLVFALYCSPSRAGAQETGDGEEDFVNLVGLKMVWVPAGNFEMGSPLDDSQRSNNEGPVRRVAISDGFWMSAYEIPQFVYEAIMAKNPSRHKSAKWPVSSVLFDEAVDFCHKLTVAETRAGRLPAGYVYSLPSEAQWEYACRGGLEKYESSRLEKECWLFDTCIKTGQVWEMRPREVGTKKANPWGLHDMLGNVWEWCIDSYHGSYDGAPATGEPWVDASHPERIIRGGSYRSAPRHCRPTFRISRSPTLRIESQGFRVVLTPTKTGARKSKPAIEDEQVIGGVKLPALEEKVAKVVTKKEKLKPEVPACSIRVNSVGMRLVYLPKGSYTMRGVEKSTWKAPAKGKEKKENLRLGKEPGTLLPMPDVQSKSAVKPVTIRKGFWIGACEVTQKQYEKIMDYNPSHFVGEDRPVESLSWDQARQFCKRLSIVEGRKYRLPSEAEWEYACRAGTGAQRYGDAAEVAWYKLNSGHRTHAVGQQEANDWGLFDTLGNVKEWCSDAYGVIPGFICTSATVSKISKRIVRGGSWKSPESEVRAASRSKVGEKGCYQTVGFRVVCEG